jgi:hypothetical protein
LRERVTQFWKAFEEGKYRKADALVLEDDKDDFFSWSKKQIFKQEKSDIKFSEDGKLAEVMTPVDTDEFMVGVGQMRITRPVLTYWKLADGNWWWFHPKNVTRETPFGKMILGGERDAARGTVDVARVMSKGPTIAELMEKVKANKSELKFQVKQASTQTVEFQNGLPGTVALILDIPPREDFSVTVDPKEIPRGGTGVVIVKYTPGPEGSRQPARPGVYDLRVTVAQTGKTHTIKLTVE